MMDTREGEPALAWVCYRAQSEPRPQELVAFPEGDTNPCPHGWLPGRVLHGVV